MKNGQNSEEIGIKQEQLKTIVEELGQNSTAVS